MIKPIRCINCHKHTFKKAKGLCVACYHKRYNIGKKIKRFEKHRVMYEGRRAEAGGVYEQGFFENRFV